MQHLHIQHLILALTLDLETETHYSVLEQKTDGF